MVPTADNNTPAPAPTGNLEQLFRQQLGEAEVAPRTHLWEQIDHELLVQQNETYRRRLVWHRWVAAACILLFLGAGGWFSVQGPGLTGMSGDVAGIAANPADSATSAARQAATNAGAPGVSAGSAASAGTLASAVASGADPNNLAYDASIIGPVNNSSSATGRYTVSAADYASRNMTVGLAVATRSAGASAADAADSFFGRSRGREGRDGSAAAYGSEMAGSAGSLFDMALTARNGSYTRPATASGTWFTAAGSRAHALAGLLAAVRPDTLKAVLPSVPTTTMALAQATPIRSQEDPAPQPTARARRWRLMGSYGASAYNPNMAFGAAPVVASASGVAPNGFAPARASNTYEQAAAEYRQNLRPGFAQRVALTVSYAATKHWTISSGVQAAEQQATSQTSYSFLDGKLPVAEPMSSASKNTLTNALTPPRPATLHTAQYRYRTAGVPVSVRYGSAKNGVSLYAKVGAAVNVLFSSQSELVGAPDSRTAYSLNSTGSPYRKVQAAANAGAGVRYKPTAAQWSLSVGPTAEAGLSTLNANAAHSSYQTRPYAIGLEASVEFGGRPATILH